MTKPLRLTLICAISFLFFSRSERHGGGVKSVRANSIASTSPKSLFCVARSRIQSASVKKLCSKFLNHHSKGSLWYGYIFEQTHYLQWTKLVGTCTVCNFCLIGRTTLTRGTILRKNWLKASDIYFKFGQYNLEILSQMLNQNNITSMANISLHLHFVWRAIGIETKASSEAIQAGCNRTTNFH